MRILIITQWCEPEPTFKGLVFARELANRGHEVEILTGFPNYPGGKLYEGYRVKPYQRDEIDGIVVHRVPLYPSHDKSAGRRIANYASFALSAAVLGPLVVKRPDVIYAYHPPPTIGLPAIALKRLLRAPLVYDIQDMWPDTVRVSGMLTNKKALGVIDRWCKLIYHEADRIVVLSPGFKRLLEERGVPGEKITVIYNWTHETEKPSQPDPEVAKRLGFTGRFNVLFAGTMGTAQSLDAVLDAAKLLSEGRPEVQFVFVGGGVERERLAKRVEEEQISNTLFLPRQEPAAMGPILAAADVLIVHLKDEPLFRVTIPSKTQAYLAAGKLILIGARGDAADLVERAGAGLTCEPDNDNDIARSLEKMLALTADERQAMGRIGREFYERELSVAVGVERFDRLFAMVTEAGRLKTAWRISQVLR